MLAKPDKSLELSSYTVFWDRSVPVVSIEIARLKTYEMPDKASSIHCSFYNRDL